MIVENNRSWSGCSDEGFAKYQSAIPLLHFKDVQNVAAVGKLREWLVQSAKQDERKVSTSRVTVQLLALVSSVFLMGDYLQCDSGCAIAGLEIDRLGRKRKRIAHGNGFGAIHREHGETNMQKEMTDIKIIF